MGNITASSDDTTSRFDRSLGAVNHGTADDGPNQLRSTNGGEVNAEYDDAGNMVRLKVQRPGNCPAMSGSSKCAQWFEYAWDEVGQLARARRWDFDTVVPATEPEPATPAQWDLHYAYSGGLRTLKTSTDDAGSSSSTLEIFDSLRIEHVPFDAVNGNYAVSDENVHLYIAGFGHVVKDSQLPRPPQAGMPFGNPLHILLSIPDHLGSTGIVIDRTTGEVVERASHQAFGAVESDFRPDRWSAQREQYKFTGKEEDLEVGLHYFGARYYHARLNRWISPDPLTIHGLGADLNPYAYVSGKALAAIDPYGFEGTTTTTRGPDDADGTANVEVAHTKDPAAAAAKAQTASSGTNVGPIAEFSINAAVNKAREHAANSPVRQAAAGIGEIKKYGAQGVLGGYRGAMRATGDWMSGPFNAALEAATAASAGAKEFQRALRNVFSRWVRWASLNTSFPQRLTRRY